jgi:carbamoyl-phosphate synthase small subunit
MVQRDRTPALLLLEDGARYAGWAIGAAGESFGELVFNTGMTGYQEVLTDPSYRGQIVVMTYPEIGIYGVNADDVESARTQVAGFVVHRAVSQPFNHRATQSLTTYLAEAGIVAIEGIDTRALTRHLRTCGAMRGVIATGSEASQLNPEHLLARVRQSPEMQGANLASQVTPAGVEALGDGQSQGLHIAILDAGRKEGIVRGLIACGARVTALPYDAPLETVRAAGIDGVLISNGPGDPEPLEATIRLIRDLLRARVPVAGICLGHQLLGLAAGCRTYKMRFGHRGANHPIKELKSGKIVITTQNHGFAVDPTSLGIAWAPLDAAFEPARPELFGDSSAQGSLGAGGVATMAEQLPSEPLIGESPVGFGSIEVTHLSLNDGTVEGLRLFDYPAFSVQFHPEASPGPHDAKGFFEQFIALIRNTV